MVFLVAIAQTENYDFLGSDSANYENYRDDFLGKRLGVYSLNPLRENFVGEMCVWIFSLQTNEQDFCREGET